MIAKRVFDFLCASVGLLLLIPLFTVIAIAVKLDSPGPAFFRQERVGREGALFRVHKFRTMITGTNRQDSQLTVAGDLRVTRVGQWLRRTKLDELPQLIDVFQGTMSLVGPRPEVPSYVALYPDLIRNEVLSISPGITDFASILFRKENDLLARCENPQWYYRERILPRKLKLHLRYVRSRSFRLDFCLIIRTILTIFR